MLGVGDLHLAEPARGDTQVVHGHMALERRCLVTRHDGKVEAIQRPGLFS
jgi:hypothetical protein